MWDMNTLASKGLREFNGVMTTLKCWILLLVFRVLCFKKPILIWTTILVVFWWLNDFYDLFAMVANIIYDLLRGLNFRKSELGLKT